MALFARNTYLKYLGKDQILTFSSRLVKARLPCRDVWLVKGGVLWSGFLGNPKNNFWPGHIIEACICVEMLGFHCLSHVTSLDRDSKTNLPDKSQNEVGPFDRNMVWLIKSLVEQGCVTLWSNTVNTNFWM